MGLGLIPTSCSGHRTVPAGSTSTATVAPPGMLRAEVTDPDAVPNPGTRWGWSREPLPQMWKMEISNRQGPLPSLLPLGGLEQMSSHLCFTANSLVLRTFPLLVSGESDSTCLPKAPTSPAPMLPQDPASGAPAPAQVNCVPYRRQTLYRV